MAIKKGRETGHGPLRPESVKRIRFGIRNAYTKGEASDSEGRSEETGRDERRQSERLEALSPARCEPETQICCYLQCFRNPRSLSGPIWAMRRQESSAQGSEIKLQMHRAQARALPGGESIAQRSKNQGLFCPASILTALRSAWPL